MRSKSRRRENRDKKHKENVARRYSNVHRFDERRNTTSRKKSKSKNCSRSNLSGFFGLQNPLPGEVAGPGQDQLRNFGGFGNREDIHGSESDGGGSRVRQRYESILKRVSVKYTRMWQKGKLHTCSKCKSKERVVSFNKERLCFRCVTNNTDNDTVKRFIQIYYYMTSEETFDKYDKISTCLIKSYTTALLIDEDLFPKELPEKLDMIPSLIAYGIYYLIYGEIG